MIIGINGFKGSGKDTVADYFVQNHGFVKAAFADKLKEAISNLFGIPLHWVDDYKDPEMEAWVGLFGGDWDELGSRTKRSMNWRTFLQRFGTEMGRNTFGENFWVDMLVKSLDPDIDYVIPDARFENELQTILSLNGTTLRVERPGLVSDGHKSEESPDPKYIVCSITNDSTIEQLHQKLDAWYKSEAWFGSVSK